VLVEELGVSRTVVREALSSLEALGLIETRGTRGRFVTSGGSSERSRSIVSAWLHQHAPEILEVDEIRSVLEAQATPRNVRMGGDRRCAGCRRHRA